MEVVLQDTQEPEVELRHLQAVVGRQLMCLELSKKLVVELDKQLVVVLGKELVAELDKELVVVLHR